MALLFNLALLKPSKQAHFTEMDTLFNVMFLGFMNPLMELGFKKSLVHEDIGSLEPDVATNAVYTRFLVYWKEQMKLEQKDRSIWTALRKTVGYKKQVLGLFLSFISAGSAFGPPLILKALNAYFNETTSESKNTLWILVALLLVIPVIGSSCLANCYVIFTESAIVVRNVLTSAVYRKIMVLSPAARREFSSGRVVNLFSVDINMILMFIYQSAGEVYAPLQLAGALYLIYREIGDAMFAGFALVFGVLPLLLVTFIIYGKLRAEKNVPMDARIKLTNEILNGIRIIKYYGWELPFVKKIEEIRSTELSMIFKLQMILIAIIVLITSIPYVMPIVLFYAYANKTGNQLTVGIAFTTLALLGLVTTPVMMIPGFVQRLVQAGISMARITQFLMAEEMNDYVLSGPEHVRDGALIYMDGASFAWSEEDEKKVESVEVPAIAGSESVTKNNDYEAVGTKEVELTEPMGTVAVVTSTAAVADSDPENRSVHTLTDITFSIKPGELVCVVGGVGSGKSSLLSAIMGEIGLKKGSVYRGSDDVAYHCQQPWILNATLKENILFGLPFEEERFENAIDAACLHADIASLPDGLDTEIGEKGINLSGGQKARISFARTVYRNADIYLLDDPLSAVDAHVGMHLFTKGICGALKGKTVVLVTHQVHLVGECDKLIVLLDGRIRACGSPAEVKSMGVDISKIVAEVEPSDDADLVSSNRDRSSTEVARSRNASTAAIDRAQSGADDEESFAARVRSVSSDIARNRSGSMTAGSAFPIGAVVVSNDADLELDLESSQMAPAAGDAGGDDKDHGGNVPVKAPAKALHTVEERVVGDVSYDMYAWYFALGGYGWVLMAVFIALAGAGCQAYSSFYLADWGKDTVKSYMTNGVPLSKNENLHYVNIYCAISMMGIVSVIFRTGFMVEFGVRASQKMHRGMLDSVMNSPVSFFDTTPIGRIVNRFTSDTSLADEALATNIAFTMGMVASLLGSVGSLCYTTDGALLIMIVPLTLIFQSVQLYFRRSNTELKRLDNISKSPVFAEFNQTLNGVSSVKAYRAEEQFVDRMAKLVDTNSQAMMQQQLLRWWLTVRLETLGGVISCCIGVMALGFPGLIKDQYIPLSLNGAFALVGTLKWLVATASEVEATMSSVERINHYNYSLPPEETPEMMKKYKPVPKDWPSEGRIVAKDLQVRYSDGPVVLKGLNFDIKGSETIGIVGRTGCGKSSLMVSLFRIENPCAGSISIDGVDLQTVPLHVLRPKLGIIPQDAVVFSITVRFNLDPFDEFPDSVLWDVLDRVAMKETVMSFPLKLAEIVSEGGDNFSAGQRQLLCIARVLLRQPKVLVLDEATASVDNETDDLIQKMVRDKFKDSTVLTIAHRLHTVIDANRIMLLNDGLIAELDAPAKLLENKVGLFSELWKKHVDSRS